MYETIEHNGETYRIRYRHYNTKHDSKEQPYTVAWIKDVEGNVVVKGIAKCSKKDQFNKKFGRIIAKGRMLKLLKAL